MIGEDDEYYRVTDDTGFQSVREELRYMLLSEGDTDAPSTYAETGIVVTVQDAASSYYEYFEFRFIA